MTAYERLMQVGQISVSTIGESGDAADGTDSGTISSGNASGNKTVNSTEVSLDFLVTVTVSVVRVGA